jgi:hypothetical protein
MTIAYASNGGVAYSSQNGTSVSPAYPSSIAAGDMLVLFVHQKPSSVGAATCTTPSGWTSKGGVVGGGYGATLGIDTGDTRLNTYYKVAAGTESGSLTVTVGGNNICAAVMLRFTTTGTWFGGGLGLGAGGEQATAPSTSFSNTATSTMTAKVGDVLVWAFGIPTDVTTPAQFSSASLTMSGYTTNTTELGEWDTSVGQDLGGVYGYTTVTAIGGGSVTPVLAFTLTGTLTNVRGRWLSYNLSEVFKAPPPTINRLRPLLVR